ncbi:hypothetical protein EDC04DRAFT_2612016 [Pisolithus marmoratus]|nr:hypothetical protein EDC04DRAFT_2612016 [Pisolithus marmoratus]
MVGHLPQYTEGCWTGNIARTLRLPTLNYLEMRAVIHRKESTGTDSAPTAMIDTIYKHTHLGSALPKYKFRSTMLGDLDVRFNVFIPGRSAHCKVLVLMYRGQCISYIHHRKVLRFKERMTTGFLEQGKSRHWLSRRPDFRSSYEISKYDITTSGLLSACPYLDTRVLTRLCALRRALGYQSFQQGTADEHQHEFKLDLFAGAGTRRDAMRLPGLR